MDEAEWHVISLILMELPCHIGRNNPCLIRADVKHPRAIEHFQVGETATFIEHIRAGLEILEAQPNSLLVFSG